MPARLASMARQRGQHGKVEGVTTWIKNICQLLVYYCKTGPWTLLCKEMNAPAGGGRSALTRACCCLSLPPSLSFFVLAQDQDSGVRGQVPCFEQAPNIWVQGRHVSCRASLAGASYGHYIITLQNRPQLHFPALFVHHHHRKVTPTIHSSL